MEDFYPIDVNLISKMTGLPSVGVKPEQYLNDKMKKHYIAEEVKEHFGTDIGSIGMIIKNFNEPTTIFLTKWMAYKLLRKCRKEEAPTRVVISYALCTKGTVLSWAPYLLNLFL
jgi:hypothetical protein